MVWNQHVLNSLCIYGHSTFTARNKSKIYWNYYEKNFGVAHDTMLKVLEIFDIDLVQNHFPAYWTINYESTQIFNFIDVSSLVQKCPWIPNGSDGKNENSNFSATWCFLYMKFNCLKYYQTRLHKSQVLLNNRMTQENERMIWIQLEHMIMLPSVE